MNNKTKIVLSIIIVLTIMIVSVGCDLSEGIALIKQTFNGVTPPGLEYAERFFVKNENDVLLLTNYLQNNYSAAFFFNTYDDTITVSRDGHNYADEKIEDKTISDALLRLWKSDCRRIGISKEENAVYFMIWVSNYDTECGLLFSLDSINKPRIQSLTELIPLPKQGWYYYVSDYYLSKYD